MKSIKSFALMGAVALIGSVGFTSCEQKNKPENQSGEYNGETVKTQFSISIPEIKNAGNPAGAPGVLRMPADNTQDEAADFLGMDNIKLMPFNTDALVEGTDTRLGNIIPLAEIATSGLSTTDAKYKVYSDVSIPLGTNHFLFYAHGKTPTLDDETKKFSYGQLTANNIDNNTQKNPSSITFDLVPINVSGRDAQATLIAEYLTSVANANDGSTDNGHTWATYSLANGGNDGIYKLHEDFIELKAGSAMSVLKTMEDLYNSLDRYNDAYYASHSANDAVVKAVMDAIAVPMDITGSEVGKRELAWKETTSYKEFPRNFSLPDGSAAVNWQAIDGSHAAPEYPKFLASTTLNYNDFGVSNPASYVYPACIYYYANSTLETSTKIESTNYGDNTWANILLNVYEDNVFTVGTSTRSVAIVDPIQYGVARLKTSVVATNTTLKDWKEEALATSGNTVNISGLTMTGVLIGGQGSVGYDFVPASAGSKIVYDKVLTSGDFVLKTTDSPSNPTLLLETVANEAIRVAVEFENNDKDFYGEGGKLIPKGTRFYVVGQLNSSSRTAAGSGNENKVFEQDFTTLAKFSLSSLKHAYNVVPDLRTEKMELGFSVDLSWQTGNTYTIDINNY